MLEFAFMLERIKKLIPEPVKVTYHLFQAAVGALIFFSPSRRLKIIGVSGTDGKTTTVHIIHHMLNEAGEAASMISTVEAKIGGKPIDTGLHVTTPDPIQLQKLLGKIARSGSKYAVVEVTSHGLAQGRTAFVNFFAAVITNVTHEHLDYHKTYENYLVAKAKLLSGVKLRVLNADDESFKFLKEKGTGQLVSFGIKNKADFAAKNLKFEKMRVEFDIYQNHEKGKQKKSQTTHIKANIPGEYNVYNILAAFAIAKSIGIEASKITSAIEKFNGVAGRMQKIDEGQDFEVIVDFAHTPNALGVALKTLRAATKGKIIAVFGSAGERDVGKRSLMGKVATEQADISVFTAEDPRREDVNKIIDQIASGAKAAGGVANKTFLKIPDRVAAINTAIQNLASPDDTVAIFGKGHEKSMNIGGVEYPWSDEAVARNALKLRLKRN